MNKIKEKTTISSGNVQNNTKLEIETSSVLYDGYYSKVRTILDALGDNYSSLINQNELLMVIIDKDLNIQFMNTNICDLLHYSSETILKKSIFSFISPTSHDQIKSAIFHIKDYPNKVHKLQDLSLYCSFEYEHFFEGLVINLTKDERVDGYLFYLHNITEHHKIEVKLKDLNLELDSFVYKASHDLRAPLASLSGLIYLTEADFPLGAKANFDMMKTSVLKLDKFIQQLAHYSRNNNTEADYTEIDFSSLISDVIDGYKHLNNADKIYFDIDIQLKTVIMSDEFRLKVILGNLISNAIKYHQIDQFRPFIRITVTEKNGVFFVCVEDNGMGIAEKYINKIFDMFVRATDYNDGSGLGLYILKKALEKLKGDIKVRSQVDRGSIFEVIIPNYVIKKTLKQ